MEIHELIFGVILPTVCMRCIQLMTALDQSFRREVKRKRALFARDLAKEEGRHRRRCSRRRLMMMSHLAAAYAVGSTGIDRRIWSFDRYRGEIFWTQTVLGFTDDQWRKHFRMSKATFDFIAEQLRPALEKQYTHFREPIHYRRRLAVVIWWLATPSEYRTVSTLFGIGVSTLCKLTREVCFALHDILLPRFISLPNGHRLDESIEGFQRRGFPQCAGAIDGTHLPVIAPHDSPEDYHNRKGWHSIILQAVVDHNYCFIDIYVGWPGRTHDARVFANSSLCALATQNGGYLFPREKSRIINGVEVPVFLIGDPAYPLQNWMMKAFTHHPRITPEQRRFNFRLSSARIVVENTFGRLKGRWRRLLKRNDVETGFASTVVTACCILHNICETFRDEYNPEWDLQ